MVRSPDEDSETSTRKSPFHLRELNSWYLTSGCKIRQSLTGMTLLLLACLKPRSPLRVVTALKRVRYPSGAPTSSTSTCISRFAIRANCSAMTSLFNWRCRSSEICWKSHPPQPARCANWQGALTRSADGVITFTTSARLNELPVPVISISTSSPGIACLTKITAPRWREMK